MRSTFKVLFYVKKGSEKPNGNLPLMCRLAGFSDGQTATLVKGKPLEYAGELYSEEHRRRFKTEKGGFQVVKDPTDGAKLVLAIDRKPIAEWFKEQSDKLFTSIRKTVTSPRKNRGIGI